jgi:mannose-1-phosphate guanylyltransferase
MLGPLRNLPLWCIVQADGDRLCQTSCGLVPVQYWSTDQSPPLIQRGLHRALRLAKPRQIIATVADAHRHWWEERLWCVPARRRIVDESSGRPTVTLAAAMSLIEREAGSDAIVVLQPTDTFHASESAFIAGLRRAVLALERLPTHVVTLTVQAYKREPGQDYVLLGADDGLPGRSAARVIKRPQPMVAERLIDLGALLSTGVYVARLSTLTRIIAELWPDLMATARTLAWTAEGEVRTPARMIGSQFCRPWRHTWVQRPLPRLRAVSVDDCGWSSLRAPAEAIELSAESTT